MAYTKGLADAAIAQLSDDELHHVPSPVSNSVAVTMKHIAGNQRSRWTDFLTSDGEKSWRHRDTEFEEGPRTREEVLADWESGWAALFGALDGLTDDDLQTEITVRGQPASATSAILRQLAHYGYHVGQIVYVARWIKGDDWQTLSVPRGGSDDYNRELGHTP